MQENGKKVKQAEIWSTVWKIIVDLATIGIFGVMAYSIRQTNASNKIARESLERSYVPWVCVESISPVEEANGHIHIDIILKNYGQAPALTCKLTTIFEKVPVVASNELTLMPGMELTTSAPCPGGVVERTEFAEVKAGRSSVYIQVEYKDVFGKNYRMRCEMRFVEGRWGTVSSNYE